MSPANRQPGTESTLKITPMLQQYLEIKQQYGDALLFYRMGDFYELFFEDAVVAARELEIALTTRDKNVANPVPMCGVPHHAADGYINRLLAKGYKVAVCEQVEDPRAAKGLVRREVVRVVTPGTALDSLEFGSPNYLAAVDWDHTGGGLAFLDLSTADFRLTEAADLGELIGEVRRIEPRELLIPAEREPGETWWRQRFPDCSLQVMSPEDFDQQLALERLLQHFRVQSLRGFGINDLGPGTRAAGAVLAYVQQTQQRTAAHIRRLIAFQRSDFMIVDEVTSRHLEIFRSWQGDRRGTLIELLDRTRTAMGARLLRNWLRYPLLELPAINRRQDAVACLRQHEGIRGQLRQELRLVYDLERLHGRIAMGVASPRDCVALRASLQCLPRIRLLLAGLEDPGLQELAARLDPLEDVATLLQRALVDEPPAAVTAGGVIRPGYDKELDQLLSRSRDAKRWIAELEAKEREKTGIASLKVGYNRVFGYYLEVSKSNLALVPENYIRKQTLVNAERYVTEELKEYENQVLSAEERRVRLEDSLFQELRTQVAAQGERIQQSAAVVAEVDVYAALAELANRQGYCRPQFDFSGKIHIEQGRHPVVEAALPRGTFVPNDVHLDNSDRQILIITGPNMAGKSTILRQVALIVLMAQAGMPVPASSAKLSIVDRIFTRVGATDEITRGRSTFMVEMQETAHILHQATADSLVILDEIGRGTSTFDGLSIAWAVVEYLHDWQGVGIKTLFATHYHELTDLSAVRPRVKNMNVAVKEWGEEIIFLRKLVPGGSNRSYGIQVARLAGLPAVVVERAREILAQLEKEAAAGSTPVRRQRRGQQESRQLPLFEPVDSRIRARLAQLEIERLTPLQALNELAWLRDLVATENTPEEGD